MVSARSENEIKLMRESGKITAVALKKVLENIKPGVSGLKLDDIASYEIKKYGGQPAFKTVDGYNWSICITLNEQVVHGIPTGRLIKEGDVVSIDIGSIYKGWYTDAAWTTVAGDDKDEGKSRFLEVGKEALKLGIKEAVEGNRVGDISEAIQKKIEGAGYWVVRNLVGHGVGKQLHEEPEVPGFGVAGTGPKLKRGMTLAIEVIYTHSKTDVVVEKDGWTISAADGSLAGLFEMTIVVGKKEAGVLTDWRKVKMTHSGLTGCA